MPHAIPHPYPRKTRPPADWPSISCCRRVRRSDPVTQAVEHSFGASFGRDPTPCGTRALAPFSWSARKCRCDCEQPVGRTAMGEPPERFPGHRERMTTETDELLTPQQLANYLSVPVATLYDWRYRGDGPPGFRLGKHIRYRKDDVDRWINSRVVAPDRATNHSATEGAG